MLLIVPCVLCFSQCAFVTPVEASKIKDRSRKLVNNLFSSHPSLLERFLRVMLVDASFSPTFLPLLDYTFTYYVSSKLDFPTEKFAKAMEAFSKSVLGSTTRPDYLLLESCTGVFKKVSRQTFQDTLLPAMLKALLRNPDELTRGEGTGLGSKVQVIM